MKSQKTTIISDRNKVPIRNIERSIKVTGVGHD